MKYEVQTVSGGDVVTVGTAKNLGEGLAILKMNPDLLLYDGEKHIVFVDGEITTLESISSEMEREKRQKIPLHREPGPFEKPEDVREEARKLRKERNMSTVQSKIRQLQDGIRDAQTGLRCGLQGEGPLSQITARIFGSREDERRRSGRFEIFNRLFDEEA